MEKQDLVDGLKNSVERDYSLEEAIQSFINAGYPEQNVRDSAKLIGGGILKTEEKAFSSEDEEESPEEKKLEALAPETKEELGASWKVQKKSTKKIIILFIILGLLIIIGAVGFIFRAKFFG